MTLRFAIDLRSAARCPAGRIPRPTSIAGRRGLSFQKRVDAALARLATKVGGRYESEPWFAFSDSNGPGQAVPDGLFFFGDRGLIVEVKYTYELEAGPKLQGLYLPVVEKALHGDRTCRFSTLILCRNLNSLCPRGFLIDRLSSAFLRPLSVLQWLGHGPIDW